MAAREDDLDLDVEAEVDGAGGGGKMKIIIVAIAIVLVLGISGAATLLLLGGDSKPAPEAMTDTKDTAKKESRQESVPKAPLFYIGLNPPFVVNFSSDEDARFLQIDVQISSRDPSMMDKIREHDPAIRNNLVILFSSQNPKELNTREGKEKLRAEVLAEVKKVLKQATGSDNIENVYFTNFVMQ